MKKYLQTCKIKGHQGNEITSICTYKQCQQEQRMMCNECLQKQIHNHGSQMYMTKLDDFLTYLNRIQPKIEEYKWEIRKLSELIQGWKHIIQQLQTIVEQQENYSQHMKNIDKIKIQSINLEKLTNQQLHSLINIDEVNKNQIQNNIQKIIMQLQEFNKGFVKFKEVQQIDVKREQIRSPNISLNEQYLSYIVDCQQIRIDKIQYHKNVMNKNFGLQLTNIVKFSLNSNFIFVGDIKGNFKYFSFKNNFKRIFSKRINWFGVSGILQIDDNQVIIAQKDIFIVDLIKRRILLRIDNSSIVYCLEFDKINDLIICAFEDKKIKFFSRDTRNSVISKSFSNKQKIVQIQLINKSQNLLGCDLGSLRLFQIDLKKKKLNLIKEFCYDVQYFRCVQQEQRIIMRNINQLIITDPNFNIIYELQIRGSKFEHSNKFYQLESMNYIIIKDKIGSLKILKNMNN